MLQRKLGLWSAISIVVGGVIGSSIFMKPALMASQVGSPIVLLLVWLVAGVFSLFGSMIMSEISGMLPATGAQFVFLQKMYGDFMAYLLGWGSFFVINTAGVASIAFIFSEYFEYFYQLPHFSTQTAHSIILHIPFIGDIFPLENFGVKSLTILLVILLSYINFRSVKESNILQVLFTSAKIFAIGFLVVIIFTSGKGTFHHLVQPSVHYSLKGFPFILAFIAATSGAFAAYDGWSNLAAVAGEVINPQKNLSRAFIRGMLIVIGVYMLSNIAYLYILDIDAMSKSKLVAASALEASLGSIAAGIISALIMFSCLGATHINIMAAPRITFAMADAGYFFKWAGKVHPKFQTPGNAVWLHAIWICILVISGSFDMLTDMFVFITWLFFSIIAIGLFVLRRKMPAAERPYKVWGYPVVPALFILFALMYLFLTVYNDVKNYVEGRTAVINSLLGLALTLLGVPFYWYFRKHRNPNTPSSLFSDSTGKENP